MVCLQKCHVDVAMEFVTVDTNFELYRFDFLFRDPYRTYVHGMLKFWELASYIALVQYSDDAHSWIGGKP